MPQPVRAFAMISPQDDLVSPLRRQVALARSLLDECDRAVPAESAHQRPDMLLLLREQLVEELGRLGCRLLECAATLTDLGVTRAPAGRA